MQVCNSDAWPICTQAGLTIRPHHSFKSSLLWSGVSGYVNVYCSILVLFTRRLEADGDQVYTTLENSSIEKDMVVGVFTIKENEPLVLLNKQVSSYMNKLML